MFDTSKPRIGFACKIDDQGHDRDYLRGIHGRGTTAQAMRRLDHHERLDKLTAIVQANMTGIFNLIQHTHSRTRCRMLRLGSSLLPLFTHPEFSYLYHTPEIQEIYRRGFHAAGRLAADRDIRLSFHPGQFCCLASDRPEVIQNSVEEFEYHSMMAWHINNGAGCQVLNKINVHLSGRGGPSMFRDVYNNELSEYSKSLITIENDEIGAGVDKILEISDLCPIVLDLHHHWVHTSGHEFIMPEDHRWKIIRDSWNARGTRPVIHYSYSRVWEEREPRRDGFITEHDITAHGDRRQKLRAHSDLFPNREFNRWALRFFEQADIMCESKRKDTAAEQLIHEHRTGGGWWSGRTAPSRYDYLLGA